MTKIVLTTDLSEESKRAFAPTAELARNLGAEIILVHIVPELKAVPHGAPFAPRQSDPESSEERQWAKAKLDEWSSELGESVVTAVLASENVEKAICKFAESEGADYIALSTHGRTGVRHLVLGSIAEGVLRHAKTPVVCFPQRS
jgi:nucleotide-binding universal stress UspA family protein